MKNYVICTTLEEQCVETLKHLKDDIDLKQAHVHILTLVQIHIYNAGLAPYVYPEENQYKTIEEGAMIIMKGLATSLGIDESKLTLKCMIEYEREEKIKSYISDVKADLAIVATKNKYGIEGLFSSSFSEYLCKFAPCDVLVMKAKK